MSAIPPPLALQLSDFPNCPPEMRDTLETLLRHLTRSSREQSEALRGLSRGENVRGGYLTATADSDGAGVLTVTGTSPLGQQLPRAVWAAQLRDAGGHEVPQQWGLSAWRLMAGGMLRVTVRGVVPSTRYTLTAAVE
jgi:hypothetical protein